MFLCDDCHSPTCRALHLLRSHGPCEGCKKVASCADCHDHHRAVEPPPPATGGPNLHRSADLAAFARRTLALIKNKNTARQAEGDVITLIEHVLKVADARVLARAEKRAKKVEALEAEKRFRSEAEARTALGPDVELEWRYAAQLDKGTWYPKGARGPRTYRTTAPRVWRLKR